MTEASDIAGLKGNTAYPRPAAARASLFSVAAVQKETHMPCCHTREKPSNV